MAPVRPISPVGPEWFREYWGWVGAVLFVLLTLDLLTTVYAVAEHGTAAEANPLMAWALREGIVTVVAVNLTVGALAVFFFWGVARIIERMSPPADRRFALLVEVWLGLLLLVGLVVFANNVSVVVLDQSLL